MKKMLVNFGGVVLARNEMSSIKGGTVYQCHCTAHTGSWSADWPNQESANASIDDYCRGGGTCTAVNQ
jgi:hypothetical protein